MNQCPICIYLLFIGLLSTIWSVVPVNGQSDSDIDEILSYLSYGKNQKQPDGPSINPVEKSVLSSNPEALQNGKNFEINLDIGYGSLNGSSDAKSCANYSATALKCDSSSQYRTWNASCNNLMHPTWGMTGDCQLRFVEAFYDVEDGFRKSVLGGSLPQPRDLSLNIFTDVHKPTQSLSFMFTIFGQFLAHEITSVPSQSAPGTCCSDTTGNRTDCATIQVKSNDPFYSHFNVTCLEFVRNSGCSFCRNGKRQQPNAVTAAIDGSLIYGPNKEIADEIRVFDGTGRLKSKNTSHGELLPKPLKGQEVPQFCQESKDVEKCFLAGDGRVNQHATLTAIQTVWMREHNRVANILKELNPHWDNEKLYQEARKIIGAMIQCIVYKTYLPLALGTDFMSHFGLWISPENQGTQYDSRTQIGIIDEFSTAVFRLHSMVATNVGMGNFTFKNYYSNPDLIRRGRADPILQGVCKVPSEQYDRWFVNDVNDYLYKFPKEPFGEDLTVIDIQRGRDHGMPPYVVLLHFLSGGKTNISSFEDLESIISPENVKLLKENYLDVRDVDLWVGLQMEKHVDKAIFGRTSCEIVGRQFHKLKYGDRFYFEHEGEIPSFTPAQRESLKQSSLSRVLCDNTKIKRIQRNALLLPSDENPEKSCSQLPQVNLTLWKSSPEPV